MKKNIWLLIPFLLTTALYAQEETSFGKEDLLAAFEQYNPSVLERAAANSNYGQVLYELTNAYHAARNEQQRYEMIALVKNFDNSLLLYMLRQAYFQRRSLQEVSGLALEQSTREQVLASLRAVLQDIFKQTLAVKNIQLQDYKQQLKQIRKDTTLTAQEKQARRETVSEKIKQVKQEIRTLKKDSKQKIAATAEAYLAEMDNAYESFQQEQFRAEQSAAHDIKANHKKPVAQ